MDPLVIRIQGLCKSYRIRHQHQRQRYVTLRDVLADKTLRIGRRLWFAVRGRADARGSSTVEDFWALRDVSLEVKAGESVGIIGRNGAGKSTLLKVLSRVTEPTSGRVELDGRVASLLEVGTGFHPELTGRENIYLNGAVLGMRRAEIKRKFDEIVAFADVERFLDTPVKRYSSGMYVRLAFAVAAHLEPEILIVDEVLAVGDTDFQKKCLGKMGEASAAGRTVLFVSHNMAAIEKLCPRAVLLHQGRLDLDGDVRSVLRRYLSEREVSAAIPIGERTDREGDGTIRFTSLRISGPGGAGLVATGSELRIALTLRARHPVNDPVFLITLWDMVGDQIIHMNTRMAGFRVGQIEKEGIMECRIPRLPLPPGRYRLNVTARHDGGFADRIEAAAFFDVAEGFFFHSSDTSAYSWGKCLVEHEWKLG